MRLEHANITVQDIDAATAYYRRLFDFQVLWEGTASGAQGPIRAVHLGNEDTYLSLFEAEKPNAGKADYGVPGVNHIGFQVESLAPYRARLAELGTEIHFEPEYDPGRRIYFFDPDGVEIELVEYDR